MVSRFDLKGLTAIHKIITCVGPCVHLQIKYRDLDEMMRITD